MVTLRKITPSFPSPDLQHWGGDDINNLVDIIQGNSFDKIAQTAIDSVANGGFVTATGTQTLTNKTIDFNTNTLLNLPAGGGGGGGGAGIDTTTPNTWSGIQTFLDGDFALRNPTNTFSSILKAGAQTTTDKTFTLPVVTASDVFVALAAAQTLTNKTIDATNNSIVDTGTAAGDILKSNGTKFLRFARGAANTVLTVNSSGTDLAYTVQGTTPISYQDMSRIAIPSNPASNNGRVYVKQIDTNNDGLFILIKKAGGFVEVQVA